MSHLNGMRSAPRDSNKHPKTNSGKNKRSVDNRGIISYANSDSEDEDNQRYKVLDKKGRRNVKKETATISSQLEARELHSKQTKSAWQEKQSQNSPRARTNNKSRSKNSTNNSNNSRSPRTKDSAEDFEEFSDLARTVRGNNNNNRPKSARNKNNLSATAPARLHTSVSTSGAGEINRKMRKLEKTVEVLQSELETAQVRF
mgnify:FL=1